MDKAQCQFHSYTLSFCEKCHNEIQRKANKIIQSLKS